MWFLEHLAARDALPARPGPRRGTDRDRYRPPDDQVGTAIALAVRTFGQDDAEAQLWGRLDEAGFGGIEPGERPYAWRGTDTASVARYMADVVESSTTEFAARHPDEATFRRALGELRALGDDLGTRMRTIIHKARAVA
jgi:hypothetical protein